jgi:hypothetical protein
MAIFRHHVVLSGCSRDWFQQFVVEVHNEVEALRFDGGHLIEQLSDGQEGDPEVVLVAGRHARKGAEYRIGPEAGGYHLTIIAWDRARETGVRVLSREDGATATASVNLRSANRPEIIELAGDYQDPRGSWIAHRLSWRAKISLTGWWEYLIVGKGPAPAVVDVAHPLLKAKLKMFPRPAQGATMGSWAVEVVGVVHGRSWARPLIAVGLGLTHPLVRISYRKMLNEIAGDANPVIAALAKGNPATAAKKAVESLYSPKDRDPAGRPGEVRGS